MSNTQYHSGSHSNDKIKSKSARKESLKLLFSSNIIFKQRLHHEENFFLLLYYIHE